MDNIYALKVSGNSLIGDGIEHGDIITIDPEAPHRNGMIYIVRIGNEVVARHVYFNGDHLKLIASNGDYREISTSQAEILGAVLTSDKRRVHWR